MCTFGPASSFATSRSDLPQNEQRNRRLGLEAMLHGPRSQLVKLALTPPTRQASPDSMHNEAICIETVPTPTGEVVELIKELDQVLSAEYPPEQRHGLALEAIFQPHVLFFL